MDANLIGQKRRRIENEIYKGKFIKVERNKCNQLLIYTTQTICKKHVKWQVTKLSVPVLDSAQERVRYPDEKQLQNSLAL